MPGWRNWQTRRTQNPVLVREWEFDPPSGHQLVRSVQVVWQECVLALDDNQMMQSTE